MNETLRNHALKITVASICTSVIFVIIATWSVASAKAAIDSKNNLQDSQIELLTKSFKAVETEMKGFGNSLVRIETTLGIKDTN